MATLFLDRNTTFIHPEKYDPDEERYYSIGWRPPARLNGYEYLLDDIALPESPNGFYYVCTKPGVSAPSQPTMPTTVNGTVTDGTVTWKAQAYNLELRDGDTVTSTWTATTGVTTDNPGGDGSVNWVRVTGVPDGTRSFKLTNRVTITRLDGKVETLDGELTISVKKQT